MTVHSQLMTWRRFHLDRRNQGAPLITIALIAAFLCSSVAGQQTKPTNLVKVSILNAEPSQPAQFTAPPDGKSRVALTEFQAFLEGRSEQRNIWATGDAAVPWIKAGITLAGPALGVV